MKWIIHGIRGVKLLADAAAALASSHLFGSKSSHALKLELRLLYFFPPLSFALSLLLGLLVDVLRSRDLSGEYERASSRAPLPNAHPSKIITFLFTLFGPCLVLLDFSFSLSSPYFPNPMSRIARLTRRLIFYLYTYVVTEQQSLRFINSNPVRCAMRECSPSLNLSFTYIALIKYFIKTIIILLLNSNCFYWKGTFSNMVCSGKIEIYLKKWYCIFLWHYMWLVINFMTLS